MKIIIQHIVRICSLAILLLAIFSDDIAHPGAGLKNLIFDASATSGNLDYKMHEERLADNKIIKLPNIKNSFSSFFFSGNKMPLNSTVKGPLENTPQLPTGNPESFRANVLIPVADSFAMVDGILVDYEDIYSNAVDYDDALKMTNSAENISLKRDGSYLMVERRNTMGPFDTLYLTMTGMRAQSYRWLFTNINMNTAGRIAFLKDSYLSTSIPINLSAGTTLDFTINSEAASYASNRFSIIFEQVALLPVTFTSVTANHGNENTVKVAWHVENELDINNYIIERSLDGIQFTSLGRLLPALTARGNYFFQDKYPTKGDNFYRVKATSLNGRVQYSAVVQVKEKINKGHFYSTLETGKKLNIFFSGMPEATYNLLVISINGRLFYSQKHTIQFTEAMKTIDMQTAPAGMYIVVASSENGFKQSLKIIIE
ncbi:MAG: T9SS type A sorting domain-containing protein [Ferruginibacter sp.]